MILTARNTSNQWGWQVFSDINNAIHKNAVNSTTFNGDVDFPFAIAVNGTPANVSFLTYEYDWYTTPKPTNVPGLPLNLTLTPKMKYNNEWYQRATLDVINGPSSITITSKGFITFKNLI